VMCFNRKFAQDVAAALNAAIYGYFYLQSHFALRFVLPLPEVDPYLLGSSADPSPSWFEEDEIKPSCKFEIIIDNEEDLD